jgi:hypothetical protein
MGSYLVINIVGMQELTKFVETKVLENTKWPKFGKDGGIESVSH